MIEELIAKEAIRATLHKYEPGTDKKDLNF